MLGSNPYPVSVEADYQERFSFGGRFLWLIKWLLIVPHLILLPFLALASFFTTIAAWVAILITGRYPRSLFQFNAGLMAWGWRVSFFSYMQGATNRYPQFGTGRKDYPAQMSFEYPERSSRLLALPFVRVILALPHLIIVSFIQGMNIGAVRIPGIRDVLVLFALLALVFTGRYPESLFAIILGMNRWSLRVTAYMMLLTDKYPPFRFGD